MSRPELPREELDAAIEARRELGLEMEPQVIEGFLERIEKQIDARVDARVAKRKRSEGVRHDARALALGSLGIGIPLSAIAGGIAGLPGLLIAWVGIVLVNLAHAWAARR